MKLILLYPHNIQLLKRVDLSSELVRSPFTFFNNSFILDKAYILSFEEPSFSYCQQEKVLADLLEKSPTCTWCFSNPCDKDKWKLTSPHTSELQPTYNAEIGIKKHSEPFQSLLYQTMGRLVASLCFLHENIFVFSECSALFRKYCAM